MKLTLHLDLNLGWLLKNVHITAGRWTDHGWTFINSQQLKDTANMETVCNTGYDYEGQEISIPQSTLVRYFVNCQGTSMESFTQEQLFNSTWGLHWIQAGLFAGVDSSEVKDHINWALEKGFLTTKPNDEYQIIFK